MGIKGLMSLIQENAPGAVREIAIESYTGRVVAIDASMALYQFLIAIRHAGEGGHGGGVLTNAEGEQTSHIQGMFNRTIRLLQAGVKPVYVFDGKPPAMKGGELASRAEKRRDAEAKLKEALKAGDGAAASKYEGMLTKVSRKDCEDVKVLLRAMGVPVVYAPCEAEAQCAELCKGGSAHAVGTEDMDALTFGSTVQLRHMTFSKKDKNAKVVEITYAKLLSGMGLTRPQFVDLCILCGCDYTSTIRGVGPKTALKLIREHGTIEAVLTSLPRKKLPDVPDGWLRPEDRVARAPKDAAKAEAAEKDPSPTKVDDDDAYAEKDAEKDAPAQGFADPSPPGAGPAAAASAPVADEPISFASAPADEPISFSSTSAPTDEPISFSSTSAPADEPMSFTSTSAPPPAVPEPEAAAAPEPEAAAAPEEAEGEFVPEYVTARGLFNEHEVTPASNVDLVWGKPDDAALRKFLIEKMGFNADRVEKALANLTKAQGQRTQRRMDSFFKVLPPKPGAAPKKRPAPPAKKGAAKKGRGPPRK